MEVIRSPLLKEANIGWNIDKLLPRVLVTAVEEEDYNVLDDLAEEDEMTIKEKEELLKFINDKEKMVKIKIHNKECKHKLNRISVEEIRRITPEFMDYICDGCNASIGNNIHVFHCRKCHEFGLCVECADKIKRDELKLKKINKNDLNHYELPDIPDILNEQYVKAEDGTVKRIFQINKIDIQYVRKHQRNDPVYNGIIRYLITGNSHYIGSLPIAAEKDALNGLYKIRDDGILMTKYNQMIAPQDIRASLVHYFHSGSFAGHQSPSRMEDMICSRFYWKGMKEEIKEYNKNCLYCQVVKKRKSKSSDYFYIPSEEPTRFNEVVSMDSVGPIKMDQNGNQYYTTIKDNFSTFTMIEGSENIQGMTLGRILMDRWIYTFGSPDLVVVDNGSGYHGVLMRIIRKIFYIECHAISPYNAKANGSNEVTHKFINDRIAIANKIKMELNVKRDNDGLLMNNHLSAWSNTLKPSQFVLNAGTGRGTGISAAEIVFGSPQRIPLDAMLKITGNDEELKEFRGLEKYKEAKDYMARQIMAITGKALENLKDYKRQKRLQHDKNVVVKKFKVGQNVMVKVHGKVGNEKKYYDRWKPGFVVIDNVYTADGTTKWSNYKIKEISTGKCRSIHVDYILPFNSFLSHMNEHLLYRMNQNNEESCLAFYEQLFNGINNGL